MIFLHTKYFPNYLTRMNFHLTFKKYFFLKCKYILVTSIQSEALTDLRDKSFDKAKSVRRWREIYRA